MPKIVFDVNFYKKWLLKTCFFHLEAFLGRAWEALEVILGCFGVPFWGHKMGPKSFGRDPHPFGASLLGAQCALEGFLGRFLLVFEGSGSILGWIWR